MDVQRKNNLILYVQGILKSRTVKLKYVICSQRSPKKYMQSNEAAMLIQHMMSKKHMPQEDDKNCQSKRYYGLMCSDKNCQENENINMQPELQQMNVQLLKTAVSYEYRRLYSYKNCQSV